MSHINFSIKAVRTREKLQDKILRKELITNEELHEYTQEAYGKIWKAENYTEQEKNKFEEGVFEALVSDTKDNGKSKILTNEEILKTQEMIEHNTLVKKFAEMIGGKVVVR
jgi:hypothetical protein